MKIIELRAENFKRIEAVEIRPDGALVQITGKNGQGKTSVLDALWVALQGASVAPVQAIRKGAEAALIRLDLGEIRVTRRFRLDKNGEETTDLTVEREGGGKLASPQAVLDAVAGALTFDPLGFVRGSAAEQIETLRGLIQGVDFAKIDRDNKADFDDRRDANRAAKDKRARADGIKLPPGALPKPVDVLALEQELAKGSRHNTQVARLRSQRELAERNIQIWRDAAVALREQAAQKDLEADALDARLAEADPLPEEINAEAVVAALQAGREGNLILAQAELRNALEAEAVAQEHLSAQLTERMAARDKRVEDAVKAAKLPVDGLAFTEADVLYMGVPLSQASDAQQLRVSIAIAAALAPDLRIARVRDGSLLDEDGLAALAVFAEEQDLQIWLERVDSSGSVGFVLENGRLKGDLAPAEAEAEAF